MKDNIKIAIVGVGPRGLSVFERLCANSHEISKDKIIEVHLIDPYFAGSGKVWRTNQPNELLMNTVASQVTLYTDNSVECLGPKINGPTLYEWAKLIATQSCNKYYSLSVLNEANNMKPNSYATRSFYGYYLEWVYEKLVNNLPSNFYIHFHQTYAISLDDTLNGMQRIAFKNGKKISVHKVILTLGHTDVALSNEEIKMNKLAKEHNINYFSPSNPADVNLDKIKPKEHVILRGLGLNFFDYMSLLTIGRGGKFEEIEGELVYKPSGEEPHLIAGSRRGIPYHARGENEKGVSDRYFPLLVTPEVIRKFRDRSNQNIDISFLDEVWPLIAKEVETVYYATLIKSRTCTSNSEKFQDEYIKYKWGSIKEKRILKKYNVHKSEWWYWTSILNPHGRKVFRDKNEFQSWLLNYLETDLSEAQKGNISGPLKAALDILRDLRNEIRLIIEHNGISGESYKKDVHGFYTSLNAFVSIGPPALRISQMIALIKAGILDILGPHLEVKIDEEISKFTATSNIVSDVTTATTFIEARLPDVDIKRTADSLLSYLIKTGQCKPYVISTQNGKDYETGGIAVTPFLNNLINKKEEIHPDRFAFGIPTEGVHWITAVGIRPGVNSVTLTYSDSIARSALNIKVQPIERKLVVSL